MKKAIPIPSRILNVSSTTQGNFKNRIKSAKEGVQLIKSLRGEGKLSQAKEIWTLIYQQSLPLDAIDYTSLFKFCTHPQALELGQQIYSHLNAKLPPKKRDTILQTAVMNMFLKCGKPERVLELWHKNLPPDRVMYLCILAACAHSNRLDMGKVIHQHIRNHRFPIDETVYTSLIKMYTQCGEPRMIDQLWNEIQSSRNPRLRHDATLYTSVLSAISEWAKELSASNFIGDTAQALAQPVKLGWNVYEQLKKSNTRMDVILWNSLIIMFTRCGLPQQALTIWNELAASNVKPTSGTYTAVLLACADAAALQQGKAIHQKMTEAGQTLDVVLTTSLINMYAKAGSLEDVNKLFADLAKNVAQIDIIAWNALLSAHAQYGRWDETHKLFLVMLESRVLPDEITFSHLLTAASHSGKVDEARDIYREMAQKYHVTPNIMHQTIIVDVLARSGLLDEAEKFIETEIKNPSMVTWRTLLGGCRSQKDVERAERVAKNALKLNPKSASVLVMLSNIYASAGRWEDRDRIRNEMDRKGIKKIPGQSTIEVDGHTHTFVMRDDAHHEQQQIYTKVKKMHQDLKKAGFVPDTSWSLKNVDEEEKENELCYHSEKLAMAYGLLHSPPGSPLVISKNLRVCGNCHESTKWFSKLYKREIIVRDASRFHHFHEGKCSCGDFW